MPNTKRQTFKHLIVYDTDKTTVLSDVYLNTYDEILNYLSKNYPQYACSMATLRSIVKNQPIQKYNISSFIKISIVQKKDIPKMTVFSSM